MPDSTDLEAVEVFPVYSTAANRNQGFGAGNAVHLGTFGRWTLCGTHKIHSHLPFDSGFPISDLQELISTDPDEVLCKRCRAIARSSLR